MRKRKHATRTPEEFRDWLYARGITLEQWCKEHGFKRQTVSDLLRGAAKGRYGASHRAAVAIGLKPAPPADQEKAA